MKTARYKIISDSGGNRYQFFCALSGALVYTTEPYRDDDPERELELAWEKEGRAHFDLCHECGKWVSSVMYNADTLKCVKCSPWEYLPKFCPHCGKSARSSAIKCKHCGKTLRYSTDENDNNN